MAWWNIGLDAVAGSVTEIAKEWIDTDKESAEAKAIMVKTLDPNGNMRRQIARDVTLMYKIYILTTLSLITAGFFGLGEDVNIQTTTDAIVNLFLPITGMFTAIVSASFGVNAMNVNKDK